MDEAGLLIEPKTRTLLTYWARLNVFPNHGATPEEIGDFERRHSVRMPIELVTYFEITDGMSERSYHHCGVDPDGFRFWRLSEVKRLCDVERLGAQDARDDLFVVADHREGSWHYAIRMSIEIADQSPVFLHEKKITESFAEFLEVYMAGSDALWYKP
jgi:hypothetical protein